MKINVTGAREHNLKGVDVEIGDGLTVVTGVSGSGKTSLVFDTIYRESQHRFQEIFAFGSPTQIIAPARVDSITGLGPTVAVDQNHLNRNPNSTLATASGLHVFLRLLYARFSERICPVCGEHIRTLTEDEIIERVQKENSRNVKLYAPLVRHSSGSHRTLLNFLESEFGRLAIRVDGFEWSGSPLDPKQLHNLEIKIAELEPFSRIHIIKEAIQRAKSLGADNLKIYTDENDFTLSCSPVCSRCGTWIKEMKPHLFNMKCPNCNGDGCPQCRHTGLTPEVSGVTYADRTFNALLQLNVDEISALFTENPLPGSAQRLNEEITKRLDALKKVGLEYISLDRSSPSLSRGEAQRVKLAVALTSRLEDILHVLDEPTVGQHPNDVARLLPAFRELKGPVIYVEHDRLVAADADNAIDMGPGAGSLGGEVTFTGTPRELWDADTPTGRYFSLRSRVKSPAKRKTKSRFIKISGAYAHNLSNITVKIPLNRLTVVTGVSGSGKSTLVEDILVKSLQEGKPIGCIEIEDPGLEGVLVDQSPIGKNPRSTPATYTKLSDIIRKYYSLKTALHESAFSFNTPEGACPTCEGMGSIEVKMRYLPSTWTKCTDCEGKRYKDEILNAKVEMGGQNLSIADFYEQPISESFKALSHADIESKTKKIALDIFRALIDIGLGYLSLSQPSPSLSGGEAQRVKLAKYLGRGKLGDKLIALDEPSTGLHPKDVENLITVLDNIVASGATVIVVEHNTDLIRASDWIVDLGPGAGPKGGKVVYNGDYEGLLRCSESLTGKALLEEDRLAPRSTPASGSASSGSISIRGANANNLRDVDIDFPKGAFTVVTGLSGSGKSSLVSDILETEARRRYLETLSLYERQGTKEGPEAPVESVTGLGVTVSVTPDRKLYNRRSTVGTATEISPHLTALFSSAGERTCLSCGSKMIREQIWVCPGCGSTASIAPPRRFSPLTYAAACTDCNGVGSLQKPLTEKLIRNPEKPLCGGAMHSPGFFPQGYLCKPGNGGYDVVQAFAARHGFDPKNTPWNKVPEVVRKMFYFGDPVPLEVEYNSPRGKSIIRTVNFAGFYGWIRDWDVGGTYSENIVCPTCKGTRLRSEYLAVTLGGFNIHQLGEMPLKNVLEVLNGLTIDKSHPAYRNIATIRNRLKFLQNVGLSYLKLNRVSATLSAGEAQRVKLAGLLGSGITSLTVLMDEPTRGLHPREVSALLDTIHELREEGNTVIVVEHEPMIIRGADYLVDMGPGPGTQGGQIVAKGSVPEVSNANTMTGIWLRGERKPSIRKQRRKWINAMTVTGARENNLKNITVSIPLGILVGVCGVSGSGKSTLMIDTIARALNPVRQTTSVAYEPVDPGKHDTIIGAPQRTLIVDQSNRGITTPASYLNLSKQLRTIYVGSEDAAVLEITEDTLSKGCTACNGSGYIKTDMEFLPDLYNECETCMGTGYSPEAWGVKINGYSLPELNNLTLKQVYELFKDEPTIAEPIKAAIDVGLGYLVLKQPAYTLSGGESQRLRIAGELYRKKKSNSLYILDEPTLGQHMEDVERLAGVLHRLVDEGNSVVVVEHNPNLLAQCDWLIELGPESGPDGGAIIAENTPEELAKGNTPTAIYIKQALEASY